MKFSKEELSVSPEDRRNASWDNKAKDFWTYKEGQENLNPFFYSFLEKYRSELGQDVLDIGLGTGQYAIPLIQRGFKVTGVEPSKGMRREAKSNFKKAGLEDNMHMQLLEDESKHLSFSDASFDWGIMIGVIHHNPWPDVEKSFQEAVRVLKPGTLLVLMTRSVNDSKKNRERTFNDPYGGFTALELEGRKKGVIQHYFTEQGLKELGAKNGLQIVERPKEELVVDPTDPKKQGARWWVVYRKKQTQ